MVALGLIVLVLSGALTLGVVLSNTDPVTASAFGVSLSNVTVGGLFLVGAVTGLAFMLGLTLMAAGASRRRAKRVTAKRQVRDVRTEKEQLAQENAELKARLEGQPYPSEDTVAETDTERHGLFHR
jgi:hypothetical protein